MVVTSTLLISSLLGFLKIRRVQVFAVIIANQLGIDWRRSSDLTVDCFTI